MRQEGLIKQIGEAVRRVEPTADTILYGSQARGDATLRSDIDLLILTDGERLSMADRERITMPLYLLELQSGVIISSIVMTRNEWKNRPFKTPFQINIANEGIKI